MKGKKVSIFWGGMGRSVARASAGPAFSPKCAILPTMSNVAGNPFDNPCINTGDTTWVLISTVLVLTMFGGLAFFEGTRFAPATFVIFDLDFGLHWRSRW